VVSREDLKTMLSDLAEDISQAPPVSTVIVRAHQVRRRRVAVLGAIVAVVGVVAASTIAVSRAAPVRPVHSPTGTPSPTNVARPLTAKVDRLPVKLATDPIADGWPTSGPPLDAPLLASAPVTLGMLLYAPTTAASIQPVYVYGQTPLRSGNDRLTYHWARLGVSLMGIRDADGGLVTPLDVNSMSNNGERAAFAQPDWLVVVDLQTGAVDRISVPGPNEHVSWLLSEHVLVSSPTQTWLVDVRTRSVVPAAAPGAAVAPLVGDDSGLTTVSLTGSAGNQSPMVTFYDDGGLVRQFDTVVDARSVSPYHFAELNGRGWRRGTLIAQAASGPRDGTVVDFVAVFDGPGAVATHLLDLGPGRRAGCCAALGWSGPDHVLVYLEPNGVLDWDLTNGDVHRRSGPLTGTVSIALYGCDYTIRVQGITSGCVQ
jgi:hypothetical protein